MAHPGSGPHPGTRGATLGAILVAAGLALAPGAAHAGGFEFPDSGARAVGRGGAYVVGVQDPTALYYNPGALAKQRGTTLMYHHNLAWHDTRFSRVPLTEQVWGDSITPPPCTGGMMPPDCTQYPITFDEARDGKNLFPLGPFFAVATDFGLDNWTFAAGAYGPSAVGSHDYEEYGPQSFMLTDMDILLAYYSVAAAWKLRDVFGIGVTLQYVDLISMKYALVTDSRMSPGLNPVPDADSTQLVTEIDLKDRFSGTAIVGLWYRPHRRVELGLASRVVPIFLRAKGKLNTDRPELFGEGEEVKVELPMTLPAKVRGGVRYIHDTGDGREQPWFDLELAAHYENWAVIESFDLKFDGRLSGLDLPDLSIDKNWKDTVSLRLGGDVNVLPPYLTVRAGGFWESPAMRDEYAHLDFPSFMRGGIGGGVTGGYKGIYLTVGYMHIFQKAQEITEAAAKQYQERPLAQCPEMCAGASGVPANAGRFTSHFDVLALGLDIRFRELLGDRRGRRKKRKAGEPATEGETAPAATSTGPAEAQPDATSGEPGPVEPDAGGREPETDAAPAETDPSAPEAGDAPPDEAEGDEPGAPPDEDEPDPA